MNSWGQKKSSRDGSDARSDDKHLSVEFRKKLEEWQKRKRTTEASDAIEFADQNISNEKGDLSELFNPCHIWSHRWSEASQIKQD